MLFGTSGIRGRYPKIVNETLGFDVGVSFEDSFVIARDTRRTAVPVFNSVISGGLFSGKNVFVAEGGVAPTPTLSYATNYYKLDGIMITASRNPEYDCGIKLFEDGKEISREREHTLENAILNLQRERATGHPARNTSNTAYLRDVRTTSDVDIINPHLNHIVQYFSDRIEHTSKRIKAVVDSNGAGSVITPYLLSALGCDVVSINTNTFGFYRASEPTPNHLELLASVVRSESADFGVANDGDADRAVLVDDMGYVLPQDTQLLMVVDHMLKSDKGAIISTVESSLSLEHLVKQHNQRLVMTPVGSTNISFKLEEEGALFGGEPCGEYIFRDNVHTPDGIFTIGLFVEMFSKYGPFSKLRENYPKSHIIRDKFAVSDKANVMEKLKSYFGEHFPGDINTIDGIRLETDDYWTLIRPSGTEDVIRLTVEASSKSMLDAVYKNMKNDIQNVIRG